MEKQEAIEFIRRELNNNRSQAEIISMLSQQLGAPSDLISKFVSQVVGQESAGRTSNKSVTSQPPPDVWEPEEDSFRLQDIVSFETARPDPYPTHWEVEEEEFPSKEELSSIETPPPFYPHAMGELRQNALSSEDLTSIETTLPAPQPSAAQPPPKHETPADPMAATSDISQEVNQAQLEAMILKALSKNRRQSDIVAAVCERTDMSWDESQRLVAKVASQNRKQLKSRQNCVFIPLAILAILSGLALLYASLGEVIPVGLAIIQPGADIVESLPEIQQSVYDLPWAITGFVLLLGGIVGFFLALRD